jgi:hypothetical protein
MSFDTRAGAEAILSLLSGLAGIGGAQIGVPESIGPRVYGYVTAASQSLSRKTTKGAYQREARYTATLAYRLDGDEAAAELALMDVLDQFIAALLSNRKLADGSEVTGIDTGLADLPDYIARAAAEYREYPVIITVQQFDEFE